MSVPGGAEPGGVAVRGRGDAEGRGRAGRSTVRPKTGIRGVQALGGTVGITLLLGCAFWATSDSTCIPERPLAALPDPIRESSGVVASRRHAGVYWTIEDSGPAVLWAVDAAGALRGSVEVPGGLGRDREALALGPCGPVDCLYVGDVGDNAEQRTWLAVYRMPEPAPTADTAARPDVFRFSLPDGPRDVEAVFLLPGEGLHLVTKGRNHPPTVYRHPGPLTPGGGLRFLHQVQTLGGGPRALSGRITGADADAEGKFVVLRTYRGMALHRVVADSLVPVAGASVDLLPLGEPQGEGVALGPDGRILLTGEAGPLGRRGSIAVLRCGPGFFPRSTPRR